MIRIHFIGGGNVTLESETLDGFRDNYDGKGGWSHYPHDKVLILHGTVTHVEEVDNPTPFALSVAD